MALELAEMGLRKPELRSQLLEAQTRVHALNQTVCEFLDEQIAAVKEVALRQRVTEANGEPSPELPVRRIRNGLNAAVAPLHGLIQRLEGQEGAATLRMLLMAGLGPCLHAIGGIYAELEHVRRQYIGDEEARDD